MRILKPEGRFNRPFCPQGHDKVIMGVNDHHGCYECYQDAARKRSRRRWRASTVGRAPHRINPRDLLDRMEEVRIYLGVSKAEFCRRLGIGQTAYYCWLNGSQRPHRESIERILPAMQRVLNEHQQRVRERHEARARRERHFSPDGRGGGRRVREHAA